MDVIHDTSIRVLIDCGYVAAMDPAVADAFLYSVWIAKPMTTGTPQGMVTLRMTLVDRDGMVLQSLEPVVDTPAGFLSKERIADLIRAKLSVIAR